MVKTSGVNQGSKISKSAAQPAKTKKAKAKKAKTQKAERSARAAQAETKAVSDYDRKDGEPQQTQKKLNPEATGPAHKAKSRAGRNTREDLKTNLLMGQLGSRAGATSSAPKVSPLGISQLAQAKRAFTQTLTAELGQPTAGTAYGDLMELGEAAVLMTQPKYQGALDDAFIETQINTLMKSRQLAAAFQLAGEAAQSSIGFMGNRHADYMLGDGFAQTIGNLPAAQQPAAMLRELAILEVAAPHRQAAVLDHLALRGLQENTPAAFKHIEGEQTKTNALGKAIGFFASGTKTSGSALRGLSKALTSVENKPVPEKKLMASLLQVAKRGGDTKLGSLLKSLESSGVFGSVIGGATLLGLAAKGIPKNEQEALYATRTLFKAASKGQDAVKLALAVGGKLGKVGKLAKLGKALSLSKLGSFFKLTKLSSVVGKGMKAIATSAKAAKCFKLLGPIGDIIGLFGDGIGILSDIKNGKPVGALMKCASAAGGIMSIVGSILTITGVGAAAGLPLIIAGTAVSVGSTAAGLVVNDKNAKRLIDKLKGKQQQAQPQPAVG